MKEVTISLIDEKSMITLGYHLGYFCKQPFTIYLYGDLSTGKTTFSRGFLQGLGYKGYVKSPTYTLVESYVLSSKCVYHFDLYRLTDPEELEFIGIRDLFNDKSILVVEWANRGEGVLPYADLELYLSCNSVGRQAHFLALSTNGEKLLTALS